jgi:membrane protein implicated in regulation of membrane protease activity
VHPMDLLEWYNLVFVAPIGLAAIYLILSASGIGGDSDHDLSHEMDHDVAVDHDLSADHDVALDHDVDVDHDVAMDHDVDVDHDVEVGHEVQSGVEHELHDTHFEGHHNDSFTLRALSVLGFGKVPVSILMTCLMVIFGASGLICNGLFAQVLPWGWAPTVYFWPSLAIAVVLSLTLTGWTAKGLARIMPTMETYAIKQTDLVGNVGVAVYALQAAEMGTVDVKDAGGTVHRVAAKLDAGAVPKGEEVVVVRYHKERDYYDVSESPL